MVSSASSFFGCLAFVSESNVPPSVGLDVYPPRQVISLILPSLEVMPRILIVLHLPVAHIDDITRSIAICNDAYKFAANSYNILQEFAVDNKVMITSHPEVARKLYARCKDFDRALKRIALITYESNSPRDSGISSVFCENDGPGSTLCALSSCHL